MHLRSAVMAGTFALADILSAMVSVWIATRLTRKGWRAFVAALAGTVVWSGLVSYLGTAAFVASWPGPPPSGTVFVTSPLALDIDEGTLSYCLNLVLYAPLVGLFAGGVARALVGARTGESEPDARRNQFVRGLVAGLNVGVVLVVVTTLLGGGLGPLAWVFLAVVLLGGMYAFGQLL